MSQLASASNPPPPPILAVRNCRTARRSVQWSVFICALGQLFIEASARNAISVFTVAIISVITFHFVIRGSVLRTLPLPALVVAGFNVATMSGALIAQTLSLRPLVFNLQVPEITFASCAIFQVSLLIALFSFLSSSTLRAASRFMNSRVFNRMGIMQAPSPAQLWIMGLLGAAAMALTRSLEHSGNIQYGDVGLKFVAGLNYLSYAPFLLPITKNCFPSSRSSFTGKASVLLLSGYMLLLMLVSLVSNRRNDFAAGITNLGMIATMLFLLGQLHLTQRLRRRLAIGAMLLLIVSPILADLAIAMVVVRNQRTEVSSIELVELTLTAFNDKQRLEEYRKAVNILAGTGQYEENYLANPFVARIVNTKFFDNTLSYNDVREGKHAAYLWDITINKFIALFPTPVIRLLGINLNKEDFEFSFGSTLYNTQYGVGNGVYKVGSPIGHGLSLMGPFVFVVAVPLFLLAFMALQSLTATINGLVVISPVILLQLMSVYILAALDSLLDPVTLMLRTLPQNILIYWIAFHGTRWIGTLSPFRNISSYWRKGTSR